MKPSILYTLVFLLASTCATGQYNSKPKEMERVKVVVWDTYVKKKDGEIMHFDILAPISVTSDSVIHGYGKQYLKEKGQEGQTLTTKECRRCHVEFMREAWQDDIERKGYHIIEMENCN